MKLGHKKEAGFTLLEIMVVIVILGIFASMVIPNLLGNKEQADRQKVVTDIATMESAMTMYKLDNSRYPTTDQGLEALVSKPDIDPVPRNYKEDGYLQRLPNDSWGNPYLLLSPGENGKFDIFSMGLDGEEGTEDDIGNWNMRDKPEQQQ